MELSYRRIKEIFPQFNIEPLTDADFWTAAKTERIIVREEPLLVDGYYQRKRGQHLILLNNALRGVKWTHSAFHELFHFYLDQPADKSDITLYRSRIEKRNKQELITDALALMAVCPFPVLKRYTPADLEADCDLPPLIRDRILVRAIYKR